MRACTSRVVSALSARGVCALHSGEQRRRVSRTRTLTRTSVTFSRTSARPKQPQPAPPHSPLCPPLSTSSRTSFPSEMRVWNAVQDWCSLCCEPVNVWNDHRGKRDHICLEMFYNALVHAERSWDPVAVWAEVDADAAFCLSGGRWLSPRRAAQHHHNYKCHANCDATHGLLSPLPAPEVDALAQRLDVSPRSRHYSPGGGFYANPIIAFQRAFERGEPVRRRVELVETLRYLMNERVLVLDPHNLHQASFEGSNVLFRELFTPLSSMFPHASAKEVSGLTQMVAATYNSETVFDLCGLERLVSREIAETRSVLVSGSNVVGGTAEEEAMTLDGEVLDSMPTAGCDGGSSGGVTSSGIAAGAATTDASADSDGGADESGGAADRGGDGQRRSLPFFFKGVYCRAILGALRWSLAPDTVEPPPGLGTHGQSSEQFYAVLAAHACRLLIAEMLHAKVSEYVLRVEGVFRDKGRGPAEAAPYRLANCHVYNPLAEQGEGPGAMYASRRLAGRARVRDRPAVVPPPMHWGMQQYCDAARHLDAYVLPKSSRRATT